MILKTYTRLFTTNVEQTLATLRPLHANEPHLRLQFGDWELVGLGDVLIVAGSETSLAPIRDSHGPWVVDDLVATRRTVLENGGEITREIAPAPTGEFFYARHADGIVVEYVQWKPELVEKFIDEPRRQGRLASQL